MCLVLRSVSDQLGMRLVHFKNKVPYCETGNSLLGFLCLFRKIVTSIGTSSNNYISVDLVVIKVMLLFIPAFF